MANKRWIQSLSFGIVGLLIGIVIGRQLQPMPGADSLNLYEGNADATDIESPLAVIFPEDLTQDAELERLTTVISRYNFCHLPVELVGIADSVATINLSEHSWNQDSANPATFSGCSGTSWRSQYFQGSAGGLITSKVLAHTFIQPDFEGDWIEGVTFQYEGEPIEEGDWDHLVLFGVITEDNLP